MPGHAHESATFPDPGCRRSRALGVAAVTRPPISAPPRRPRPRRRAPAGPGAAARAAARSQRPGRRQGRAPADAEKTPSGLASKVLTPGTGTDKPGAADMVKVHYTGWTTDGEKFDSSVDRGAAGEFPLNRVIKGWTEGVQLMVEGEKRRFWIPGGLAYGDSPAAPARPRACWCSTSSCWASTRRPSRPARGRGRGAQERQEDQVRARLPGAEEGHRQGAPQGRQHGGGPLLGLDHRRQDVRQLGHARRAGRVPAQRRHPGLDRGRAADGRGREDPLLDPRRARLRRQPQRPGAPRRHAGLRHRAARSSVK